MTRRDRNVLFAVGLAAIIGAFWFLVLSPTRKDSSDLDKQIATQQQRLTDAESKLATAQKAKAGYQSDYAAVAELGQAVPADDDIASMVYQLDKTANSRHIDFRSVKLVTTGASSSGDASAVQLPPGATVGAAGFPSLPFSFSFDGSFFEMKKFLASVDRLTRVNNKDIDVRGRLITIDRIVLGASRDGFPKVHADITATAFVVPPDEGLTGGATPAGPASTSTAASTTPPADGAPSTAPATAALTTGGSR